MNKTKQKQTHRYREQTIAYQQGERKEEGPDRDRGLTGTNQQVSNK